MTAQWGLFVALAAWVFGGVAAAVAVLVLARASGASVPGWAVRWMRSSLEIQAAGLLLAVAAAVHAFATNDFSLAAVARLSNTALPWAWRVDAALAQVSLPAMLVVAMVSAFGALWCRGDAAPEPGVRLASAGLCALVSTASLGAVWWLAEPFARSVPAPIDGMGLAIARLAALAEAVPGSAALGIVIVPASVVCLGMLLSLGVLMWWLGQRLARRAVQRHRQPAPMRLAPQSAAEA
jgi:cytochrome c biogenesis factor